MGKVTDSRIFRICGGILLLGLIVAPWAYVGVLLNEDKPETESGSEIDKNIDLTCKNVEYKTQCMTDEECLQAAKNIMDVCQAMDTHNDLPYTYVKYQDGAAPTEKNIGVHMDQSHNDLYKDEILAKTRNDSHTTIPLMKEGRLFGQFWSVYVSCATNFRDAVDWGLQQLDITREYVDMYPEFELVNDPWSAKKAMNNGKIASTMGLEGGHMIGSRLAILRQLFNLGIRYMTLTHNCNTPWADNNKADIDDKEVRNNGLSDFGKDVIIEMNRIGMFVDLSHVSTATMNDALDVSEAPVMFSHSSARALASHQRNVPDDVIMRVKENKGIICIVWYSGFVVDGFDESDPSTNPNITHIADHFDYIKNMIGAEHLCMGADYNGVGNVPNGMEDVSRYPYLIAELLKRGWTQDEVQGVLQENVLRTWAAVEETAERLQKSNPRGNGRFIPDDDFLEEEKSCKELYPWL